MTNKVGIWVSVIAVLAIGGGAYLWWNHVNHGEDALRERAAAYWEAIRLNDLHTAYNMEAETLNGTLLPHEVEVKREWGMRVVEYQLGDATIYGDKAEIKVTLTMTMAEFEGRTFPGGMLTDYWTFMRGKWYHGTPDEGSSALRRQVEAFQKSSVSGRPRTP